MPNGRGQEALDRRLAEYKKGAELVRRTMAYEYGADVARTALGRVSQQTGRDLEKEVTRGDLNLLRHALQTPLEMQTPAVTDTDNPPVTRDTKFTEIYERFKPRPNGSGENEPLYFGNRLRIWAENPSPPDGSGITDTMKEQKREFAMWVGIKLIEQYGWPVNLRARFEVERLTGRDLCYEMTRGDLELLYRVAENVRPDQLSELRPVLLSHLKPSQLKPSLANPSPQVHPLEPTLSEQLSQLRSLVRKDATEETIKDDLAQVWLSAEEEQPVRGECTAVRWPDSDGDVQLLTRIYEECIRGNVHLFYFDETGELSVVPLSKDRPGEDRNKRQLTQFIGRYFKVEPNVPEFGRIASNLLSYIRLGVDRPMMKSVLDVARGYDAVPGDVRSRFEFKVNFREDSIESVSVRARTRINYSNRVHRAASDVDLSKSSDVDLSKYCFVRQEGFLISGEHLRSDPAEFDPKTNLLSADRFDTIDWPDPYEPPW
jgi:hypothetical protein